MFFTCNSEIRQGINDRGNGSFTSLKIMNRLAAGKHDHLLNGYDYIILHSGGEVTEVWWLVLA